MHLPLRYIADAHLLYMQSHAELFVYCVHLWFPRLGTADGDGDAGMGSHWSGDCYRPLELSPHASLMEGTCVYMSVGVCDCETYAAYIIIHTPCMLDHRMHLSCDCHMLWVILCFI